MECINLQLGNTTTTKIILTFLALLVIDARAPPDVLMARVDMFVRIRLHGCRLCLIFTPVHTQHLTPQFSEMCVNNYLSDRHTERLLVFNAHSAMTVMLGSE